MKPNLKSILTAAGVAAALLASSAVFADKWNMPTRSTERNYFTRNIVQFAEEVKKGTEGKVDIAVHPADAQIKQPEVKRGVQTGQIQIGEFLMSLHSNEAAIFGVDSVPFLASNAAESANLLKVTRPLLDERLKKQGLRLLFVVPWPANSFYAGKEIKSTADFKLSLIHI